MWPTSRGKTRVTKPDYILSGDDEVRPWVSFASGWLSEWEQISKTIGSSCELSYSKFAQQSWVRITRILAEYYANLVIFQRRASQMLEPKTGNRLRNKIWDDKTHKDVRHYPRGCSGLRWRRSFRNIYYQHEVSLEPINIGQAGLNLSLLSG